MKILEVSAKSGGGMEEFVDFLRSRRTVARLAATSDSASTFTASN
jgi:hypothetical protein